MDNDNILNQISTALKSAVTVSSLGSSVLQPEYFNQFVREATEKRTILDDARMVVMNAQVQNIDRTGFSGSILQVVNEGTAVSSASNPAFSQNQLTAKELVALCGLTDQAARRNIERENFQNTLVSMMAERAGVDWEVKAIFGDTAKYTGSSDGGANAVLHLQDGWIKKADTKIYGTGTGKDFDYASKGIIPAFDEMIEKFPKEYFSNPAELRIYLGWTYYDGFRTELVDRDTNLGDIALTSNLELVYKGIPVKYAPALDNTYGVAAYTSPVILVNPANLVYGVFKDVTVETERVAKARQTDFVLAFESDQDYENEKAVVVAFPEGTKPV